MCVCFKCLPGFASFSSQRHHKRTHFLFSLPVRCVNSLCPNQSIIARGTLSDAALDFYIISWLRPIIQLVFSQNNLRCVKLINVTFFFYRQIKHTVTTHGVFFPFSSPQANFCPRFFSFVAQNLSVPTACYVCVQPSASDGGTLPPLSSSEKVSA